MQFLTDFADQGVVLPVFAAVAVTLLLQLHVRIALAWFAVAGFVLGTMLVLKLAGYISEDLAPALNLARLGLVTPSGHVAAAATAYGGLTGLLGRESGVRRSCLAALAVAGLIGVTRLALGEHTIAEVVVGGVIGVLGAGMFAAFAQGRLGRRDGAALLGVTVVVALACHGAHFSPEAAIQSASGAAVRDWFSPRGSPAR